MKITYEARGATLDELHNNAEHIARQTFPHGGSIEIDVWNIEAADYIAAHYEHGRVEREVKQWRADVTAQTRATCPEHISLPGATCVKCGAA